MTTSNLRPNYKHEIRITAGNSPQELIDLTILSNIKIGSDEARDILKAVVPKRKFELQWLIGEREVPPGPTN